MSLLEWEDYWMAAQERWNQGNGDQNEDDEEDCSSEAALEGYSISPLSMYESEY